MTGSGVTHAYYDTKQLPQMFKVISYKCSMYQVWPTRGDQSFATRYITLKKLSETYTPVKRIFLPYSHELKPDVTSL